jgi:hypothetical protein
LDNGHTKPQKKVKKDEEKTSITSVYTDTPVTILNIKYTF